MPFALYRERLFPWLMDLAVESRRLRRARAEVLADVGERVLEIGFGTGASLRSYPDHVRRLAAVDPSAGMLRRARRHAAGWRDGVALQLAAAERLPFPDGSFDSVVSVLTLCSVADPARALAEAARVLRPGGSLHFLEHVVSDSALPRGVQRALDPLHRPLACGCTLTRDTGASIRAAGFAFERLDRTLFPGEPPLLGPLFPVIRGVARRPAAA